MKWLKRAVMTATLFALMLLAQNSYAQCNPCYFNQLVKLKKDYYHYADDGTSWVFQATCNITAFQPETRSVVISPLSNDPKVNTATPLSRNACYLTKAPNGQIVGEYFLKFNSLKDLGTWTVTCDGQHIDPSYCYMGSAPPCNIICNPAYATNFKIPAVSHITVYNDPPTANLSHSPAPAWNQTLTLQDNAKDPDGGTLTYRWSILQKPPASSTTLSDDKVANPKLAFSSDKDIGAWKLQLYVDDNEGERKTFTHSFTVPNVKPDIKLSGGSVDALQKLKLSANPTKDPDGGNLSFTWRVLKSPPKAQYVPNHTWKTSSISFTTEEGDIGDWEFECVAEDNEKEKDTEKIALTVRNLKPDITFKGDPEIDIGQTIQVETTVLTDTDGGDLIFAWDIIQAPQNATPNVKKDYYTGTGTVYAALVIPTSKDVSYAGTWIFQLTATDNDNAKNSSFSKEYAIIVDAPPTADIQGPLQAQTKDFPIELKGDGSQDPDSPCVGTSHRCHKRLDGKPAQQISAGIISYAWSVLDVPPDHWGEYLPGPVDNVLGVPAIGDKLKLQYADLKPGDWTFQLQVKDKEGNTDSTTHALKVIEANTPPVAKLNGPARYTVDAFGVLSQSIVLSGKDSYDIDELLKPSVTSITPGMGISHYAWQVLSGPPGCTLPTLASGPSNHTVTLYASSSTVPAACQGHWTIQLTVADNDTPAKTGSAQKTVIIGNCPQPLCIDYPTKTNPQIVELKKNTDIMIYFHLDSALYGAWTPMYGLFTKLDIFHQSDLNTSVYTSTKANVLASNIGGMLVFHWDGYTSTNQRTNEGKFTVRISLLDHLLGLTSHVTEESEAIWISVAEYEILSSSDTFISRSALESKMDKVTVNYKSKGGVKADLLEWRVLDSADNLVFKGTAPPVSGTIEWDGKTSQGSTVGIGKYTIELEPFKQGVSLGKSKPFPLTVFQVNIEWSGSLQNWNQVLGPNGFVQLNIKTKPIQLTKDQLLKLGFPLIMYSQFTIPSGIKAMIIDNPSGSAAANYILPSSTTAAIPASFEITDAPKKIVLTYKPVQGTLLTAKQDTLDEFTSADEAISTPSSSSHNDSNLFDAVMLAKGWKQVGKARDKGNYQSLFAGVTKQFLQHAGTEYLWFSLWGVESEKRQVRQQADWFYFSGHGSHYIGALLPEGPYWSTLPQFEPLPSPDKILYGTETLWKDELKVVIMSGCSVLDIKDYRARSFGKGAHTQWMLAGGANSPGETWEGSGPSYLLGYAWAAPTDLQGTQTIIKDFLNSITAGDPVVEAWRVANNPAKNSAGINACAIDVSKTPHRFYYWDETKGYPDWECIVKGASEWPELK